MVSTRLYAGTFTLMVFNNNFSSDEPEKRDASSAAILKRRNITVLVPSTTLSNNATETITSSGMYTKFEAWPNLNSI